MSRYRSGRDFEHAVKHLLERAGFTVTRAAGSKGPWDLVAVKFTGRSRATVFVMLLQCKRRRR